MDAHLIAGTILKNIMRGSTPITRQRNRRRSRAADIIFAINQRDCKAIERFVETDGADPNAALCGMTPLAFAVNQSAYECAATLLRLGADPNLRAVDTVGRVEPPLVSAIRLGCSVRVCGLLLENGADPDAKDFYGHSALWTAVYTKRRNHIDLVLHHGAKVCEWEGEEEVVPLKNECPLYQAVLQGGEWCRCLVEAGASARTVDREGRGLLQLAVEKRDMESAKALVLGSGLVVVPPCVSERESRTCDLKELDEWLSVEMSTPAPLSRLCRHKIRLCLSQANGGRDVRNCVFCLPLPNRLLKYVNLDPLEP